MVFVNHVIRPKQNIWHKILVSLEKQSEKLAKSYWKPAWNVLKKIQRRKKNNEWPPNVVFEAWQ